MASHWDEHCYAISLGAPVFRVRPEVLLWLSVKTRLSGVYPARWKPAFRRFSTLHTPLVACNARWQWRSAAFRPENRSIGAQSFQRLGYLVRRIVVARSDKISLSLGARRLHRLKPCREVSCDNRDYPIRHFSHLASARLALACSPMSSAYFGPIELFVAIIRLRNFCRSEGFRVSIRRLCADQLGPKSIFGTKWPGFRQIPRNAPAEPPCDCRLCANDGRGCAAAT